MLLHDSGGGLPTCKFCGKDVFPSSNENDMILFLFSWVKM